MIRAVALAGLLLLAACNRNQAALTPDADAEPRNATAAKTFADIAAAEEAARDPLPIPPRPRIAPRQAETVEDQPTADLAQPTANEAMSAQ